MKVFFTYSVLVICIGLYIVSLSEPLTNKFAQFKYRTNSILRSDKYAYGDLFGLSFHPDFQRVPAQNASRPMDKCDTTQKMVDLYSLCDSYLWMIIPSDTFYCNVDQWKYATVNSLNYLRVRLDTTKASVLLIEFSERNTLYMLQQHYEYMQQFLKLEDGPEVVSPPTAINAQSIDFFFNKNINSNLEFNVFETAIFTPLKKWKASLNFNFFKIPDNNVAIAPDKKYLLFRPTYDPQAVTSSFKPVTESEIDTAVHRLNSIYKYYKNMGFTDVYFSMIPNPVSILYPDYNGYTYNRLVERIQYHKKLQMPIIDIFPEFKNSDIQVYNPSDSHWTKDGAYIWLNKLNAILRATKKDASANRMVN